MERDLGPDDNAHQEAEKCSDPTILELDLLLDILLILPVAAFTGAHARYFSTGAG